MLLAPNKKWQREGAKLEAAKGLTKSGERPHVAHHWARVCVNPKLGPVFKYISWLKNSGNTHVLLKIAGLLLLHFSYLALCIQPNVMKMFRVSSVVKL